jgi:hypothetical protein
MSMEAPMARIAAERFARWREIRHAPILVGLALAALALVLQPLGVGAGVGWCRADPTVKINGRVGHITVLSYTQVLEQAKGPTRIRIEVPAGAETEILHMDNGFGHGYDIDWVERRAWHGDDDDEDGDGRHNEQGGIPVAIKVFVPASGPHLPVVLDFEAADGTTSEALGRTNKWVKLEVRI